MTDDDHRPHPRPHHRGRRPRLDPRPRRRPAPSRRGRRHPSRPRRAWPRPRFDADHRPRRGQRLARRRPRPGRALHVAHTARRRSSRSTCRDGRRSSSRPSARRSTSTASSATNAIGRRRATSLCGPSAAAWSSRPSRRISTSGPPARRTSRPGPCPATSSCAPGPCARFASRRRAATSRSPAGWQDPGRSRSRPSAATSGSRRPATSGSRWRRCPATSTPSWTAASRAVAATARSSSGPPDRRSPFRTMSGDLDVVRPVPVVDRMPAPATPPAPPEPPAAPEPPELRSRPPSTDPDPGPTPRNGAIVAAYEDARLNILRSLERGDIDVAEAGRRFEALDGGEPLADAPAGTQATDRPSVGDDARPGRGGRR